MSAGRAGGGTTALWTAEWAVEAEEYADSVPEFSTLESEAACDSTGLATLVVFRGLRKGDGGLLAVTHER